MALNLFYLHYSKKIRNKHINGYYDNNFYNSLFLTILKYLFWLQNDNVITLYRI